ncbi:MAG: M20/M25/M40 family metallo-hydrolase, partial [Candidatus Aminicenantes bacterium]|nr:M20/M25/M40 family metallo-hydrolase [Candidatus Aminicenantes bacterium]
MRKSRVLIALFILAAGRPALPAAAQTADPWEILKQIVLIPGVSRYETQASDFVESALPPSFKAQRDAQHNVWFTVGAGRPHLLFVAHVDELGWTVEGVTSQGRVRLRGTGGLLVQTLPGRAVLIHTAGGPVAGVIAPRTGYDEAAPSAAQAPSQPASPRAAEAFEVDLGIGTGAEAAGLGVKAGDPVTVKKALWELSPDILTARAVDDRAGCAALLAAALRLDWSKVRDCTVTFAWDVQEEIGLNGARELAKTLAPDYVFAIDTFVSSDSPLESKRLAFAPVGRGMVIRASDSSNLVPKSQLERVLDLARGRGIPVQVGSSRGGNDGSVFVPLGAVDIPLSWPGAYAHSLIEK